MFQNKRLRVIGYEFQQLNISRVTLVNFSISGS